MSGGAAGSGGNMISFSEIVLLASNSEASGSAAAELLVMPVVDKTAAQAFTAHASTEMLLLARGHAL